MIKNKNNLADNSLTLSWLTSELKNLKDDINIFINNPLHSKRKKYLKMLKGFDETLILSIVLSNAIPFTLKYNDMYEQPIYSLYENIGNAILKQFCLQAYSQHIKNGGTQESNFNDYCINNNLQLSNDEIILLGFDFLDLICSNSSLIELNEIRFKKNITQRVLIPKEGINNFLSYFTLIDSPEIPMLIKPLKWSIDSNGKIENYGGTIFNNKYKFKNLISKSIENISVKELIFNDNVMYAVNKLASVAFTINKELLDIITSKDFEKFNKDRVFIYNNKHPDTHNILKYKESKDNLKVKEITSYNSKYLYDNTVISIAKLMSSHVLHK